MPFTAHPNKAYWLDRVSLPALILAVAIAFTLTLTTAACGPSPSSSATPASQPSTAPANSIDAVYSIVPSDPEGAPLSPLFRDIPEHREAIDRLALALDSAVVTGASARIAVDHRGRHLTIRFRDSNTLTVRRVLQCEAQPEIARMAPAAAGCNGRYLPLADTWWVEERGTVKSPDLGLWWEDMPNFMVPIGSLSVPENIVAGEPFSLTVCCWANILQTSTMDLSLVARDNTEIPLGELPTEAGFTETQLTVPAHTPPGRYWLRVSSNGFSELVEVVTVQ